MSVSRRMRKQVTKSAPPRMDVRGGKTRAGRRAFNARRRAAVWAGAGWGGALLFSGLFWLWALAWSGTTITPLALAGTVAAALVVGIWRGVAAYQARRPWFD